MIKKTLKHILKEPLFHFIFIGGLIFILYEFAGSKEYVPENNLIYVSWSTIESEMKQWENLMGRPPTEEEVGSFIDKYINDELLSREAISLGLDKGDIVIKRRLVQKIEFMRDDYFNIPEPTDEDLKIYLQDNNDNYTIPRQISFAQIWLKGDGMTADELIERAFSLKSILNDHREKPENAVQYNSSALLDTEYSAISQQKMLNLFGNEDLFNDLWSDQAGIWIGPFHSVYGIHLMYIMEKEESRLPGVEEVREKLVFDYVTNEKAKAAKLFMDNLRDSYIIKVDENLVPYYEE
jgi:hypothetical protein